LKIVSPVRIEPAMAKAPRQLPLDISRLSALLDRAKAISTVDVRARDVLAARLLDRSFNLVVVGEFKRGKSTLINALLGRDLLPTGVIPLTSVVTVLQFGMDAAASLIFDDGHTETVSFDKLPEFVTERGNPKNVRGVREAHVMLPAPCLMDGIRVIDTPGIGSMHTHNTDLTYRYLPQADAVIFVASADQPWRTGLPNRSASIRGQDSLRAKQD
jgi:ribosome biogenesis GTPase A